MGLLEVIQLLVLLILLLCSAFFSGSETALMVANRVKLRELSQEGNKKAGTVESMLKHPERLLTTILVGNNLVNIAASAIATSLAISFFGGKGVGIATGVMTILVLTFGEIIPKSFSAQRPERMSMRVAPYIRYLGIILTPVIKVFVWLTHKVNMLGGIQPGGQSHFVTEEEILRYVHVGEREGIIERKEKEMINSIFEFGDTLVKEVMIPRIDIVAVEANTKLPILLKLFQEKGHSRVPVYKETIDDIIGVVYAKDLLIFVEEGLETPVEIKKIMREAYYVPEAKRVDQLLTELQKERIHMAIVLDEYGGTAGIVTIEDLIEEIVGEIQDEYDQEEREIEFLGDGEILVDGRVDIDELNDLLDISLPAEDYETISGFILSRLGYLPEEGEELQFADLMLKVDQVENHRILKIKLFIDEAEGKRIVEKIDEDY
ncbi:MAG: hemolysin family protein [Halanaerobium sp.]|nr:hemolysin family protein [Halanaerobium sp.]